VLIVSLPSNNVSLALEDLVEDLQLIY
jgi:hypothetical protein